MTRGRISAPPTSVAPSSAAPTSAAPTSAAPTCDAKLSGSDLDAAVLSEANLSRADLSRIVCDDRKGTDPANLEGAILTGAKVTPESKNSLYAARVLARPPAGMMMLATTSHFSKGVHAFKASRYDVQLRDYEGFLEWINEYKPHSDGRLYIEDHRLVMPGER